MTYKERLEAMIKIDAEMVPAGNDAAMMKECIVNNLLGERCPGNFFADAPQWSTCKEGLTCSRCWNTEEPAAGAKK